MRHCPKCSAEYADTDIRSLCSYCMVALVRSSAPATDQPAPAAPARSATDSIMTMPMPEVVIPQITMPEVPAIEITIPTVEMPEMPAPPAAEEIDAPPGPLRRPLTPPPNPAIPQPPFIPVPGEEPEAEPAVPMPVPSPRRMPQPQPEPAPDEPAPSSGITASRALPSERITEARMLAFFFWIAAGAAALFFFTILARAPGGFGKMIGLGISAALGWYLVRQALYRGMIQSVELRPTVPVRLGASVPFNLLIAVINDAQVNAVELILTGTERVVEGSGKSSRTYQHAFHTKTLRVTASPVWTGGHEYAATPAVFIPADAPPSFSGRQNHIEWALQLHVAIANGPDIRERVPITVMPQRAGAAPLTPARPGYQLPALGQLNAAITLSCPVTGSNMPVFSAGQQVPFALRLSPQGNFKGQRIWVELGYQITGSGDHETLVVTRQHFMLDYWSEPGHEERGMLDIPATAPPTYDGAHLHLHWAVTVRHEQPWGQDHRQVFEVLMVPLAV